MGNGNFKDSGDIQTLFHLLGQNQGPKLDQKQVNKLCEEVLINFKTIYNDEKCFLAFDSICKNTYKFGILQIFEDEGIDLNEMPQYKDDEALWCTFLTTIALLLKNEDEYMSANYRTEIKKVVTALNDLDKALKLRLDLYN